MRAKRSKKYRKIMDSYNIHFSFREPYQVLCDSNFLRSTHAFKMPIQKFLENTLHGQSRPYITQCSLAKITSDAAKARKGVSEKGRGDGKPEFLPLPTEVPLRYCKHKDGEGKERGAIDEVECLAELVGGQAKGNEEKRNKQHYVLATAGADEGHGKQAHVNEKRGRRVPDVREHARVIPGVPIIYVKRSVMILEELSAASDRLIRGAEKDKFREGLVGDLRGSKRKRGDDESEDASDGDEREGGPRIRGLQRAKGPNPLSVRKKKPKSQQQDHSLPAKQSEEEDVKQKKNRRKRGKKRGTDDNATAIGTAATTSASEIATEV